MNTGIKWRCWGDPKKNVLYMDAYAPASVTVDGKAWVVRILLSKRPTRVELEYAIMYAQEKLKEVLCSAS